MSVRATTWAWEKGREFGLNNGELLLLVRIGDHADNDGICWPGTKHLAEYCVCDESTIRRNLSRLEEKGLIKRERRHAAGRRGREFDRIFMQIDQALNLSGSSEGTNRALVHGPTVQSDPDQPCTDARPYREPSGTVTEPIPPTPRGGDQATRASRARQGSNRQRDLAALAEVEADHERRFLEALERTPETEEAWSKVAKAIAADTPDSTVALWFEPIALVGEVAGQLVVSAPAPVRAWIERRYLTKLNALISEATTYGGLCFVEPQAEAAEAVA